jgi:hypothetical protein
MLFENDRFHLRHKKLPLWGSILEILEEDNVDSPNSYQLKRSEIGAILPTMRDKKIIVRMTFYLNTGACL